MRLTNGITFIVWIIGVQFALAADWTGQAITTFSGQPVDEAKLTGQYISTLYQDWVMSSGLGFSLDLSGRVSWADDELDIKPYRLTATLSEPHWEIRAGLQKLVFGPSKILRSMMWFDTLNPADPLGLTDGVYGLLGRYYLSNNTTIWTWGLWGNTDRRGTDVYPTKEDQIEWGGRVQFPIKQGEIGLSTHHRVTDLSNLSDGLTGTERRLALDFVADLTIGLWGEWVVTHSDAGQGPWTQIGTLGADYTFDLGSGLYVLAEHSGINQVDTVLSFADLSHVSALQMNYAIGLIDQIQLILSYEWDPNRLGKAVTYQMTFDKWVVATSFLNVPSTDSNRLDNRIQLVVAWNH